MLTIGDRLGSFEIVGTLGAGGMGEVYRARDTKLRRDVAIKVLPSAVAADPERVARFTREAHVLATLNHPNIAAIHGLEESASTDSGRPAITALVLELVEGPTLAERLSAGPLPIDEALTIARQIGDGLEAAHEKRIAHRDLKPANIKITLEGRVKVLDFGLAKALADEASDPSVSPTMTAMASRLGVIVGTAAYMAPEQAQGKPVDKRADIWAFGCVLFEMLTGRQAFADETITDTLVAVMTKEPEWTALPSSTPPRIIELLHRCLQKDPRQRLRDIGDAGLEPSQLSTAGHEPSRTPSPVRSWPSLAVAAAGGAIAVAAVLSWVLAGPKSTDPRGPVRFVIDLPAGVIKAPGGGMVAPDGDAIAFVAARTTELTRIWVRRLREPQARAIPGTESAIAPFWSPDGASLAFFARGQLKRVRVEGGPVETICDAPGLQSIGGTWNGNDVILFSTIFGGGIQRVAASGGTPAAVTTPDSARGEQGHIWPRFLPDGRRFMYSVVGENETRSVAVGSIEEGATQTLFAADSTPVVTADGRLLFLRNGAILAQRVESRSLQPVGPQTVLAEGVSPYGAWSFDGNSSVVVFGSEVRRTTLEWLDRRGGRLNTVASDAPFKHPALAPDGETIVVERTDISGRDDLWIFDRRGAGSLLTTGASRSSDAVWSPDGSRVVFGRGDGQSLYEVSPGGAARQLLSSGVERASMYPTDWSRDGRRILYAGFGGGTFGDIWMLDIAQPDRPAPFLRTPAHEHQARFSPNGRWIAYASDETERTEVYVRPIPPAAGRWTISTQGGAQPMWRADGRELFYLDLNGTLMSVAVEAEPAFRAGVPTPLFRIPLVESPFFAVRNQYTVSPDGQRFLMASVDPADARKLNVIVDWSSALDF